MFSSNLFINGCVANKNFLHVVVIRGNCEVRVIGGWPELVTRHDKEDEGGHLLEHLIQPLVLKGDGDLQQVDNYPSEVYVADHHDVKVPGSKYKSVKFGFLRNECPS